MHPKSSSVCRGDIALLICFDHGRWTVNICGHFGFSVFDVSVSAEDPTIDSMAAMYARMWLGCLLYAAVTKGHQCFAPIAPGVTFSFTRRDSIMTVLSFPSFPTSHMVQSNMNMFG